MIELVLTLLAITFVALLFRKSWRLRRTRLAPTPAEAIEKARREAQSLALRGAIFAVTEEAGLPGYQLEELGTVRCQHRSGNAAEVILKTRAAEVYPTANALIRLAGKEFQQRYKAGTDPKGKPYYKTRTRTEWTATACHAEPATRAARLRPDWNPKLAIVDGSNVAFWDQAREEPGLEPVRAVVDCLRAEGVEPLVVFDASIGHKTIGRHLKKADMRRALGNVTCEIVPAGTVADVRIIELAAERAAVIVTNDLFRDHPQSRPIPKRRGFCVGGVTELTPPRP